MQTVSAAARLGRVFGADDLPFLLGVRCAAERLGISESTVRRRIADGSLCAGWAAGAVLAVHLDDLEAFGKDQGDGAKGGRRAGGAGAPRTG